MRVHEATFPELLLDMYENVPVQIMANVLRSP